MARVLLAEFYVPDNGIFVQIWKDEPEEDRKPLMFEGHNIMGPKRGSSAGEAVVWGNSLPGFENGS